MITAPFLVLIVGTCLSASPELPCVSGHPETASLAECAGFAGAEPDAISVVQVGEEFAIEGLFSVTDTASHPWIRRTVFLADGECRLILGPREFNDMVLDSPPTISGDHMALYSEFVFSQFFCPQNWCVDEVEVVFVNSAEFAVRVDYSVLPLWQRTELVVLGRDGRILWRRDAPGDQLNRRVPIGERS